VGIHAPRAVVGYDRVMRPHVAVLDPGMRVPELDCFNRMSRRSRIPLTYHLPALFGMDSVRRAEDGLVGLIVLGSGASVNEAHDWQEALLDWLGPRVTGGVPSLGLCYGHQLFARLGGGAVGFLHADHHKEKGAREVPVAGARLWADRRVPLVVTHREAVTAPPPGWRVVGATPTCAVEVMEHETLPAWSFQAHPEATAAFLRNNDVPWPLPEGELHHGHDLVDAFLDECARRA
jgi:GMP synthase-like glutamine amidotransferase